jgi:Ca2+-binding RTX toxin-like protein
MQRRDMHLQDPSPGLIERLESRTLLSATLGESGALEIIGTRKADTIFVTYGPGQLDRLRVQINREQFSFPVADVRSIYIQSGALGDHIEFRALATNPDHFKIPTTIYGSTGDDLIIGPGSSARIYGGTGNDKIFAGSSRDIVYGEEGNDTIHGGQGNDYLRGGDGDDRITGGLGIDQMYGDAGNDTFYARGDLPFRQDDRPFLSQSSFDLIDGGAGHDRADADPLDRLISIESTFRQG